MMTPAGTFAEGSKVSFKERNQRWNNLRGTGIVKECDEDFSGGLEGVLYRVEILTCNEDWLDEGETIYLAHFEMKEITNERN